MKIGYRVVVGILAATALLASLQELTYAGFILVIAPDGQGNVVANGSGTLNTTGLTMALTGGPFQSALYPNYIFGASVLTGGFSNNSFQSSQIVSGPSTFGTGSQTRLIVATSGSGDIVGLSARNLLVPANYVSGTPLANQALWAGESIASMELTPGTYNYTWGSGANADFYRISITLTAVPEPSSLSLFAVGGVILLWRRRCVC